jgi:hypothetical protein
MMIDTREAQILVRLGAQHVDQRSFGGRGSRSPRAT